MTDRSADNREARPPSGRSHRAPLIWFAVMLTALLLTIALNMMLSQYQNTLLRGRVDELESLTEAVANDIEIFIRGYHLDLSTLGASVRRESLSRQQVAGLLREAIAHRSDILRMAEYQPLEGVPVLTDPEQEWTELLTISEAGFASTRLVQSEEGELCLRLSHTEEELGVFSFYVSLKDLYAATTSYIHLGESGYVIWKDSTGRILVDPVPGHTGLNVPEGVEALIADMEENPDPQLTELQLLLRRQLSGQSGTAVYSYYELLEDHPVPVKKLSAYRPALEGDAFLVVSTVMDYREVTTPIQVGALRILVVGSLLALLLFSLILVLYRQMIITRRMEAENLRLTELNQQEAELRRRQEQLNQAQRLQLMGTMTGGIAHEFNNLLTPIMGYSALLLAETPEEDARHRDLQEIYDSAVHAKSIIDQVTQFSGRNAEKTYREISLTEILNRSVQIARSLKPGTVELAVQLTEEDCHIVGNPTHIQQIVLNLCTNSIQAMADMTEGVLQITGEIVPAVMVRGEGPSGDMTGGSGSPGGLFGSDGLGSLFGPGRTNRFYRLIITDNGCGMTPEMLEQIFIPFYTTKKPGEGTGLGLPIVKQMTASHGGFLYVASIPGRGTTFELYLPLLQREL